MAGSGGVGQEYSKMGYVMVGWVGWVIVADWHITQVWLSMMSRSSSRTSESSHPLVQADQWIFVGYI